MPQILTHNLIREALRTIIDTDAHPPCWLYNGDVKRLPRVFHVLCPSGSYRNVSLRKAVYLVHRGVVFSNQIVYTRCAQYLCIKPSHLKCASRADYQRDRAKRRATGRQWI